MMKCREIAVIMKRMKKNKRRKIEVDSKIKRQLKGLPLDPKVELVLDRRRLSNRRRKRKQSEIEFKLIIDFN